MRKLISIDEAIKAVEDAFREKALGNVQMPPKVYLFYEDGDLRAMPCYIRTSKISSVKIVNSHPGNLGRGLPSVMALIVLIDPETGFPKAVMGGTWITGIRTGAAGAVAAKYLARKTSKIAAF
ncbi:MAG: ornithine cyclodeaminase family protein, partial [Nitrososphaerota archaeon]